MKTKILSIVITVSAIISLCGCASLSPQTVNGIATGAKIIAKDVATISLEQKPEWRSGFEQARDELSVLANAEKIDLRAVVAVIQKLPVKELRGKTAVMVAGDLTIVIEDFTTNQATLVTAEDYTKIRQVVTGLRDGIQIGLDATK